MEDILKRLLEAEQKAEEQVEKADAARRQMIQQALDKTREEQLEFENQAEARRQPFLARSEEIAQQRIQEAKIAAAAQQRSLRERAAVNETSAVDAALGMILGEV